MNIYNVPDELLLEMCEGWDDRTLLNMSQAYSKVYQLCWKIRNKRREEYENRIDDLVQQVFIPEIGEIQFKKVLPDGTEIEVGLLIRGTIIHIAQAIYPPSQTLDIEKRLSVLPIKSKYGYTLNYTGKSIDISDIVELRQIIKFLLDKGYELVKLHGSVYQRYSESHNVD